MSGPADPGADRRDSRAGEGGAQDGSRSSGGSYERGDHTQQRGLAGTVGPGDSQRFSGTEGESAVGKHRDAAQGDGEVNQIDQGKTTGGRLDTGRMAHPL